MTKMESNDEFKEIHVKNWTCYYVKDIIKIKYFDFDNISIDKNLINFF